MNLLISFLQRTIGQKIVMGLTGLGLCLFVLIHMAGNLLIFSGPEAYNSYAHQLHEIPLMEFFEIGLFVFFAGHILLGFLLLIRNKLARGPQPCKISPQGEKSTAFQHKLIWIQGSVLAVFLVFHILSFKFGVYYETFIEGRPVRDIYKLVVESFKNPLYTLGYSAALFFLFIHLLRGLPAGFKSLGLNRPVYVSFIEKLAWIFSLAVVFGFLAPIWYIFIYL